MSPREINANPSCVAKEDFAPARAVAINQLVTSSSSSSLVSFSSLFFFSPKEEPLRDSNVLARLLENVSRTGNTLSKTTRSLARRPIKL